MKGIKEYVSVDDLKMACSTHEGVRQLPDDFVPGPHDVICGPGKAAFKHNEHYRELLQKHLERYSNAQTRVDKSAVVSDIVDAVRAASPSGGWVRCVKGKWQVVPDAVAREKIGGAYRDILHTKYRSSSKSKKMRREALREKVKKKEQKNNSLQAEQKKYLPEESQPQNEMQQKQRGKVKYLPEDHEKQQKQLQKNQGVDHNDQPQSQMKPYQPDQVDIQQGNLYFQPLPQQQFQEHALQLSHQSQGYLNSLRLHRMQLQQKLIPQMPSFEQNDLLRRQIQQSNKAQPLRPNATSGLPSLDSNDPVNKTKEKHDTKSDPPGRTESKLDIAWSLLQLSKNNEVPI